MSAAALARDTVAVVLAGGNGTRLEPLTRHVCKPALPFGAGFRNIDFSLSNCANSGIRAIGVPTQYKPHALLRHLADVWSGADGAGTAIVTPWPAEDRAPARGYRGTADAVYRNLELIEELGRKLVLILAGDHVYKMDYRPMLARHRAQGAAVTIGCVAVPAEEARHFGVLSLGTNDRIERFVEKPTTLADLPRGSDGSVLASMGIYVFDADFLALALQADADAAESRHDFGADVLPQLIHDAAAFAYPLRGLDGAGPAYWRDVGTLGAYWQAHMDLIGATPRLRLDDAAWPLAAGAHVPRAITSPSVTPENGVLEDSLVAADCRVAGRVTRSVLFAGAEVGRNAQVADAVILPGATIGAGCRLRGVIVDAYYRVPDGTIIERPIGPAQAACLEPPVLTANASNGASGGYAVAT